MSSDIRNAILAASELKREQVELPSLGRSVWVRQITVAEKDEFELALGRAARRKGGGDARSIIRAKMIALVTVHDDGSRVFAEDDVQAIAALPACVLEPIMNAHLRLNAVSRKDMEELAKNFDGGRAD